MFRFVATERRDARPAGRAAGPRRNPQLLTSVEVSWRPSGRSVSGSAEAGCAGDRVAETDLTPRH